MYFLIFEKKYLEIKIPKFNALIITTTGVFILDPLLSLIRGDLPFISETRLSLILVPILFSLLNINPEIIYKRFNLGLLAGNLVYITIVIFSYYLNTEFEFDYLKFKEWYKNSPIYMHHIYSGLFIIISAIQVYYSSNKFKYYIIMCLGIGLLIVGSKFSFGVFILLFCALKFKSKFKYLWLSIGAAIAVIFYYSLNKYDDDLYWSSFTRIKIWKRVFSILNGDIALETVPNVGEWSYFIGVGKYTIKKRLMDYDAHNIFLQELLSNGLIGFLMLMTMILILFKKFINHKEHLLIFLCFLSFGMIENLFELQIGVTSFIMICSVLYYYPPVKE
jgi:hypothetical protein